MDEKRNDIISTSAWVSHLPDRPVYFPTIVGLLSLFFILLIIFMISDSVVSWPGVTVQLPQMEAATISNADKHIVTITQENDIFYNGVKYTRDDLKTKLSEINEARQKDGLGIEMTRVPTIVICADKNVKLENWSGLVDIARELKMEIVLVTEPRQAEPVVNRLSE